MSEDGDFAPFPSAEDVSRREAQTIRAECSRLKSIARSHGFDFLAYLLDIAEEEAAARAR